MEPENNEEQDGASPERGREDADVVAASYEGVGLGRGQGENGVPTHAQEGYGENQGPCLAVIQ